MRRSVRSVTATLRLNASFLRGSLADFHGLGRLRHGHVWGSCHHARYEDYAQSGETRRRAAGTAVVGWGRRWTEALEAVEQREHRAADGRLRRVVADLACEARQADVVRRGLPDHQAAERRDQIGGDPLEQEVELDRVGARWRTE